jgi:hypothetical protein
MRDPDTKWNPLLLILRGLGWGALGGGMLVVIPSVVLTGLVSSAGLVTSAPVGDITALVVYLFLVGLVAGVVGAVVGAALGSAGGLALALTGRRAVQRMWRARLITASVAAAIPLAKAHFFSQAWGWDLGYAGAAVLAVLGACAAVLLTPLIVHGWRPESGRRPERLPGDAREPAGNDRGSDPSGTGTQEPGWLIVGRAMSWGVIGGAALGALCWTVLRWENNEFTPLAMVWLALGGAVLGVVLGFTGGLAVALSASEGERSGARLG